jgi:hypothetical protein
MHPSVQFMLRNPRQRQAIERALASRGVHGDNRIVHVSDAEVARLKAMGGVGTRNPRTGLLQFYGDDVGGPGTSDVGGPGNIGGGGGARADARARNGGDNVGGHSGGSGAEHRGQGGIIETQPPPVITQPTVAPPPVTQPPAPIPVATAPMMSATATTDLTGGRFGKLPGWDLKPYQIGTAPTSYPTPGLTPPPPTVTQPPPPPPPPPTGGGARNGGLGGLGGDPSHPGTTPGTAGHPGLDRGVANFVDVLAQHGIHPQPHGNQVPPPPPRARTGVGPGFGNTPFGQALIDHGVAHVQQPNPQPAPPPGPPPLTAQQRLLLAAGGGRRQSQPNPTANPIVQGRPGGLGSLGGIQGLVPTHPIAPPVPAKPPAKPAPTKTAVTTKKTTKTTIGKLGRDR